MVFKTIASYKMHLIRYNHRSCVIWLCRLNTHSHIRTHCCYLMRKKLHYWRRRASLRSESENQIKLCLGCGTCGSWREWLWLKLVWLELNIIKVINDHSHYCAWRLLDFRNKWDSFDQSGGRWEITPLTWQNRFVKTCDHLWTLTTSPGLWVGRAHNKYNMALWYFREKVN